jgi:hypothetical protein
MELTPEQRQRIEAEERGRLAEEQYRAQVRERLRPVGLASLPSPPPRAEPEERGFPTGLVIGNVVAAAVAMLVVTQGFTNRAQNPVAPEQPTATASPRVRYVPATESIASGQLTVKARGYVTYRLNITDAMHGTHITGQFNASGGGGNDIETVIASENEFANWINGHQANVFWSSEGKKTNDSFDVRLGPGTYVLAFNNRFSAFTDKQVFLRLDLNYSRMETY